MTRSRKRELISRGYNRLLRIALRARFTDAQCGFKAIRADAARELLPLVEDEAWFFDTELLVLAQRRGLRIHEVPVDWVEDGDSRVEIVPTALADLRGDHAAAVGGHRTRRRGDRTSALAPPTDARAVSSVSYPARRWARGHPRRAPAPPGFARSPTPSCSRCWR